jgi:hypothetical protein
MVQARDCLAVGIGRFEGGGPGLTTKETAQRTLTAKGVTDAREGTTGQDMPEAHRISQKKNRTPLGGAVRAKDGGFMSPSLGAWGDLRTTHN